MSLLEQIFDMINGIAPGYVCAIVCTWVFWKVVVWIIKRWGNVK